MEVRLMKKTLVIILISVLVLSNTALSQTLFTVRRHVNTPFTNNDFDNEMTDLNMRLRIDNDRCNDVPCTADFQRSGNVNTFGTVTDGLDIVTTDAELQAVFAQPDRVKVVTFISRCGGLTNPSWIGCGQCPGNSFIVESTVSGETYVHEYGHNIEIHNCGVDNGHRNDCAWNIMNASTDGTNDAVNQAECQDFGGKVNTILNGAVYDGNGGPLTLSEGPYWVTGDVIVPAGEILTIQPGVEIQFKHDHKITVDGTLNADGSSQRILLFSNTLGFPSLKIDGQMQFTNGGQLYAH
jgi:galactitol-specific phosphotransferase system IIB component